MPQPITPAPEPEDTLSLLDFAQALGIALLLVASLFVIVGFLLLPVVPV